MAHILIYVLDGNMTQLTSSCDDMMADRSMCAHYVEDIDCHRRDDM